MTRIPFHIKPIEELEFLAKTLDLELENKVHYQFGYKKAIKCIFEDYQNYCTSFILSKTVENEFVNLKEAENIFKQLIDPLYKIIREISILSQMINTATSIKETLLISNKLSDVFKEFEVSHNEIRFNDHRNLFILFETRQYLEKVVSRIHDKCTSIWYNDEISDYLR